MTKKRKEEAQEVDFLGRMMGIAAKGAGDLIEAAVEDFVDDVADEMEYRQAEIRRKRALLLQLEQERDSRRMIAERQATCETRSHFEADTPQVHVHVKAEKNQNGEVKFKTEKVIDADYRVIDEKYEDEEDEKDEDDKE